MFAWEGGLAYPYDECPAISLYRNPEGRRRRCPDICLVACLSRVAAGTQMNMWVVAERFGIWGT